MASVPSRSLCVSASDRPVASPTFLTSLTGWAGIPYTVPPWRVFCHGKPEAATACVPWCRSMAHERKLFRSRRPPFRTHPFESKESPRSSLGSILAAYAAVEIVMISNIYVVVPRRGCTSVFSDRPPLHALGWYTTRDLPNPPCG